MKPTIAKCENCGAALRVEPSAGTVDCAYCGVTSIVGSAADAPGAPLLRIEAPPPIEQNAFGAYLMMAFVGVGAALMIVLATINTGGKRLGFGLGALFCCALIGVCLYLAREIKRTARDRQWFRDHGIPGRATVERISAPGDGRVANLGLRLEVSGQPTRQLDHKAVIPTLLVPRLTEGLTLPIIVHPRDPGRVEVQWHLV